MYDDFDHGEYEEILRELGIDMEPSIDRDVIPCPFCDGSGVDVIEWQGNTLVNSCDECRGTGEAVELIGEDLPKIIIPKGK